MDLAAEPPLTRSAKARAGVALFAALALLGIIALLVGGALAAFRLSARSSAFASTDAALTAAADYAVNAVVANARQLGLDTIPLGVARTYAPSVPAASGIVALVGVTRLADGVVWLVADVTASGTIDGRRRVNVVARWRSPGPLPSSSLVARGSVRLAAGVTFAADSIGDVDCRGASSTAVTIAPGAMVVSADTTTVSSMASAADSSTYFLAASQLTQLTAGAGVTRVTGDTTISGGSFDGVLIVDGALTIAGPFTASGLIISRGPIVALAGGLTVTGTMMSFARPPSSQPAIDVGPAAFRYSRCAVAAALRRAIPLRPVRERSWAELF